MNSEDKIKYIKNVRDKIGTLYKKLLKEANLTSLKKIKDDKELNNIYEKAIKVNKLYGLVPQKERTKFKKEAESKGDESIDKFIDDKIKYYENPPEENPKLKSPKKKIEKKGEKEEPEEPKEEIKKNKDEPPELPPKKKKIFIDKTSKLNTMVKNYKEEKDPAEKQKMEEALIKMKFDAEQRLKNDIDDDDIFAKQYIDIINEATLGEAEEEMKSSSDMEMIFDTESNFGSIAATEKEPENEFVKDLSKALTVSTGKIEPPQPRQPQPRQPQPRPPQPPIQPVEIKQQEPPTAMPFQQANDTIGNRNNIGLAPLVDIEGKPENVLVPPDVRKNSIRRFANFKFVDSIQNSRLGNASSLYELQEIEKDQRFGAPMYFLTTEKPLLEREKHYISRMPQYIKKEDLGLIPRSVKATTDSDRLPMTSHGWAYYDKPDRHIEITQKEINKYPISKKLGSPWNAEFRMSNMLMNRKEDTPQRNPLIYPSITRDLYGRVLYN